ncbi:MAG: hypothetical protein R2712_01685 [Vicinamibacterales bacterium]
MRRSLHGVLLVLAIALAVRLARATGIRRARARGQPGRSNGRHSQAAHPAARHVRRRTPARWPIGAGPPRDAPDRRRGVTSTSSRRRAAFDDRDRRASRWISATSDSCAPALAVMVGTVVDFPNSDTTFHNVFSLSRAKRDLGRYAAGRSKSVLHGQARVVRVFCDIHSHMSAFILVFAHPFYAVTGVDGHFSIPQVPPGTYTVVGWKCERPEADPVGDGRGRLWTEVDLPVP